jgi:hypothetical protein
LQLLHTYTPLLTWKVSGLPDTFTELVRIIQLPSKSLDDMATDGTAASRKMSISVMNFSGVSFSASPWRRR